MVKIHLSRVLGDRRLTQADLARKTGIRLIIINEMYYELVERVNLDHLDKICEVLDCKIEDLFEYVPNKKKQFRKFRRINKKSPRN